MPESPADTEKRWEIAICGTCGRELSTATEEDCLHAAPVLRVEVAPASSFDALSEEHERVMRLFAEENERRCVAEAELVETRADRDRLEKERDLACESVAKQSARIYALEKELEEAG